MPFSCTSNFYLHVRNEIINENEMNKDDMNQSIKNTEILIKEIFQINSKDILRHENSL